MIYRGKNKEYLELKNFQGDQRLTFDSELNLPLIFVWTRDKETKISFEHIDIILPQNTILCLTEFHQISFKDIEQARMIKFNKEFYCVLHHDEEVSCRGVLFYGADQLPYFKVPDEDFEKLDTVWKLFEMEMRSPDEMKLDMLQTMLKRFIILCTRLYKNNHNLNTLDTTEFNLVRDFHHLVEQYFKTKHKVSDYAELLYKSPKTISNMFSKLSEKTPLQIIHERILLEARRLLIYTDMSVKEIAYEIGFEDLQGFSRFFKKMEAVSPSHFRNTLKGNIDNT